MIRLFVAIDFPVEIKDQFADLVDDLRVDGYPLVFEKKENFHLTLKFLGWCQESKLAHIDKAISKASQNIIPFYFQPDTIGYFLKESLILWVGGKSQEGLIKIVGQLEEELGKVGFAKEKREFSAHITFAKKRKAAPSQKWRKIAQEVTEKYNRQFSQFKVEEILLMESVLSPQGSIYTINTHFPLKGKV
jgi:2'-5' RNA ligase